MARKILLAPSSLHPAPELCAVSTVCSWPVSQLVLQVCSKLHEGNTGSGIANHGILSTYLVLSLTYLRIPPEYFFRVQQALFGQWEYRLEQDTSKEPAISSLHYQLEGQGNKQAEK